MKPNDFISTWDVMADGDCIAHYRNEDKAVDFMMKYGDETWLVLERVIYFCDEVDPAFVFEDVVVEIEGRWRHYTTFGPKYSEQIGD